MKHFLNLKEEFSKHINVDQMTSLEYYKAKSTLLILSDEYKPVIKKQKRNGYTINFSASLFESQFFSNVKFNSVYSIIIYGSHSTGDNIAFSDIDILVILNDYVAHTKKQLVSDLNKLAIIHKILFKQDPLMHHGLSFENLSNFNLYSEKILPLETIKHSKYLYGSKSLNISLMEEDGTSDLSINRLKYILSELINNYNFNKKKMQFDYYLKYYISGILLIPSLFLQTQNIFICKKRSFDLCYKSYPKINWSAIQTAEVIRRDWQYASISLLHKIILTIVPFYGQSFASRYYRSNINIFLNQHTILSDQVNELKKTIEHFLYENI